VKLADNGTDRSRASIGLYHRKCNLTALRPAIGYHVTFNQDRTTFARVDVGEVSELAESLPLWQRMRSALRHEPKTLARLADELGAKVESREKTVHRKPLLFTRVSGTDGITRVSLVDSRIGDEA